MVGSVVSLAGPCYLYGNKTVIFGLDILLHPDERCLMAVCDQGYICDVCGRDVEAITQSDLYLRYVMGDVEPLALPNQRERHIQCNPAAAQYIVDAAFPPVVCTGFFAKESLDATFVKEQEQRHTRAWRRLQEIPKLGIAIPDYPLPEVLARWAATRRAAQT
jgi:hypothetical protein